MWDSSHSVCARSVSLVQCVVVLADRAANEDLLFSDSGRGWSLTWLNCECWNFVQSIPCHSFSHFSFCFFMLLSHSLPSAPTSAEARCQAGLRVASRDSPQVGRGGAGDRSECGTCLGPRSSGYRTYAKNIQCPHSMLSSGRCS